MAQRQMHRRMDMLVRHTDRQTDRQAHKLTLTHFGLLSSCTCAETMPNKQKGH